MSHIVEPCAAAEAVCMQLCFFRVSPFFCRNAVERQTAMAAAAAGMYLVTAAARQVHACAAAAGASLRYHAHAAAVGWQPACQAPAATVLAVCCMTAVSLHFESWEAHQQLLATV
jgi:hypothetical protein